MAQQLNESLTINDDCTVDVVFPGGEVARFAGLAEAEEFLDYLENVPPEQRGKTKYEAVSRSNNRGRGKGIDSRS